MSGLQYKKFRSSFSEFVVLLIKQASYSIIYDQYMIDNLVTLLTALSDSPVRAFRHTGTLAGKTICPESLRNIAAPSRSFSSESDDGTGRHCSDDQHSKGSMSTAVRSRTAEVQCSTSSRSIGYLDCETQRGQSSRSISSSASRHDSNLQLEGNENEIKSFMNFIFKGVFIHRYR